MIKTEHGQDVPGAPPMPKHQTKIMLRYLAFISKRLLRKVQRFSKLYFTFFMWKLENRNFSMLYCYQ